MQGMTTGMKQQASTFILVIGGETSQISSFTFRRATNYVTDYLLDILVVGPYSFLQSQKRR